MENEVQQAPRRPVRRRKTKLQIFKEVYLPTVIVALTIVLVLVFLIGGAIRRNAPAEQTEPSTETPSTTEPTENIALQQAQEAQNLLQQAAAMAADYNYDEALAMLDTFSGNRADFPELAAAYEQYSQIVESMVVWDDPSKVTNLSFHVLIADAQRAYQDSQYGSSYKKNFITVQQAKAILQQLYDNGYVLVDLFDLYTERLDENTGKTVYESNALRLPAGKKPLLLTQTHVNYYRYMVDGNGDGKADAQGAGFASKLMLDESGKLTNAIVLSDGTQVSGDYDLVPILERFIAEHPDFSYHGARAILGITGYDGIFGYRVNGDLSAAELAQEQQDATQVVYALRQAGYRIACYTFDNIDYGTKSALQVQADVDKWVEEIQPWLGGSADILVFARDSDIGNADPYSGGKFNLLYNAGFRFFMGVSNSPWNQIGDQYVRHNRLMVTGSILQTYPDRFSGLFDPETIG